jgi:hypothetical protein
VAVAVVEATLRFAALVVQVVVVRVDIRLGLPQELLTQAAVAVVVQAQALQAVLA